MLLGGEVRTAGTCRRPTGEVTKTAGNLSLEDLLKRRDRVLIRELIQTVESRHRKEANKIMKIHLMPLI